MQHVPCTARVHICSGFSNHLRSFWAFDLGVHYGSLEHCGAGQEHVEYVQNKYVFIYAYTLSSSFVPRSLGPTL